MQQEREVCFVVFFLQDVYALNFMQNDAQLPVFSIKGELFLFNYTMCWISVHPGMV
jgi:hypothetical protein